MGSIHTPNGGKKGPWWKNLLLPDILDHLASHEPDSLYAEYPISTVTYAEGYRKITYGDFANVVNGIAWWLQDTIGPGKDNEVLAYIGPNDLRYPALVLGAIKAGYVLFVTSPRNSVDAQLALLKNLKCRTMLSPNPRPAPTAAILAADKELRVLETPSVEELLGKQHRHYYFSKAFEEMQAQPMLVVHTSGSTGFPKALIWPHGFAATNSNMASLSAPAGYETLGKLFQGRRLFITFPPFHGAYLAGHLFDALIHGTVMIAPTSGAIPTADGLVEALKQTPADVAMLAPSIVRDLAQDPALLDFVSKNLSMAFYCGGDLPKAIGDTVASKIKLKNQFGFSEFGMTAQLLRQDDDDWRDWKYIHFHPAIGAEFQHVINDTYELHIVRGPGVEAYQPTFALFPHKQDYATRDLWVRHPSKPDLWSWHARADDIIVFLNGEKTNPISMEQHIVASNPEVKAALVVGAQRFQASLLIELEREENDKTELSAQERAAFIEKIWPSIEEANRVCPAHARVAKSHVMFTTPGKPIMIAGKGTVQRAGTLELYAAEIEKLYEDADAISPDMNGAKHNVKLDDVKAVSSFIKERISSIANWQDLGDTDDFFARGMDSLQALMLVRNLKQGLAMPLIAPTTIYTNPSVEALTSAVIKLSIPHQSAQATDDHNRIQVRNEMLKEYEKMIDQIPKASPFTGQTSSRRTVILTGSTGALGSYILNSLVDDPSVTQIYCLNRAEDGAKLQAQRNRSRGLSPSLEKVSFLQCNLAENFLGLSHPKYKELLQSTTHIIHNAWPVNFNMALPSFAPQLQGLVNLIFFTAFSPRSPHLFFISSISSTMSYQTSSHLLPESIIRADSAPGPVGYAESKYISELLLHHAVQKTGIRAAFARVSQIAGAANYAGIWNKAEWFPSLVISSLHVGAIPDSLGASMRLIDWVPIDLLASILTELALGNPSGTKQITGKVCDSQQSNSLGVFHPHNPHAVTWDDVRPVVVEELCLLTKKKIETVTMASWIARVRKDVESAAGGEAAALEEENLEAILRVNPAVKLLDFYESLGSGHQANRFETKVTEERSEKLRALNSIQKSWVQKWVREWLQ